MSQRNLGDEFEMTDEFELDEFGPLVSRLRRRDRRRDSIVGKQTKKQTQVLEASAALTDPESPTGAGFATTYHPGRFEEGWLLQSLESFYEDGLIVDVLAQVKGGKEANVYLCRANPATGMDLLAAKVYRPRKFRNLRNDAVYREGREILSGEGGVVKRSDSRPMRAMKNKTRLGLQMLHQSWILYEYGTLQRLHELGARVPKPIASGTNAILMEYVGDETSAAPILHSVRLPAEEAHRLFDEVMRNVDLMLAHGLVHGDLSAFNLLFWGGEITMIDFPQVIAAHSNHNGYEILRRDVLRICQYFAKQGVVSDPEEIAERLWHEHLGEEQGFPHELPETR